MRSNAMSIEFTQEEAWEVVEHAKHGLSNEELATVLCLTAVVFQEWRERGRRSVQRNDPYFVLYYEVDKARMEIYSEKMGQLRDSLNIRAQLAWLERAFPDQKLVKNPPASGPQIPERPIPADKVALEEIEFVD